MKIFIDSGEFKFSLEDSFSKELERLSAETKVWSKSTVVVITIDNQHKDQKDHIAIIIKIAREAISAIKGIDYLDDIITSIKFGDLTEK